MTSTLVGGVGRSPGEPVRPLSALALSPALVVLLLGGLGLRLTIAYVLFPASGFESDLSTYASWALSLAEHGPGGFYQNVSFADYPPAYLYVLWIVGLVAERVGDSASLIKLPPILLDLIVAYLLFRLVRGWTWPGPRSASLALAAAALYLFNPVTVYDASLWGQTDVAGALVLLLGLAALVRGNSEGAAAAATLAALVKPQFGVVLIPLVAAVLVKRHLLRAGSGPRHAAWAPARLARWLEAEQGPLRLVTAVVVAWLVYALVALPFGLGPLEYLERMLGTAGGYSYLSVNAYNLWALVGIDGGPALVDGLRWNEDTLPLVGPLPGVAIGAALLLAGFAWGTVRAAVRDDRWTLVAALVFLCLAFFVLPTRVHERYVFPALALMPLLAAVRPRWTLALVLLSLGAFINLHGILTLPLYGTPNVESLPLGEDFRSAPLIALSAVLQTAVTAWVALQLRPGLVTRPDGFDELAQAATASPTPAAAGPPAGRSAAPGWSPPGRLDRLVTRLSWGSVRRDRSALLTSEPGGRIDRRDVLAVVLLVLLTIGLRGFRLEQPLRMYFDEVYHARTAAEFLQHWEYREPHDIYEFTHPHLAKYAMAWGIRLAGGNEVIDEDDLGVAVRDAVIERRWTPERDPSGRYGDRLYLATGSALRVLDLETRGLVADLPLAAVALAVDEARHQLVAADGDGRIFRLETSALDGLRADSEAGAGASGALPELELVADGPGAPVRSLLMADASIVAATADAIASFERETGALIAEVPAADAGQVLALPSVERLVVDTRSLADREAAAVLIADALAGDAGRIRRLLADDHDVTVAAWLGPEARESLQAHIEAGELPGARLEQGPLIAVAGPQGVTVRDAWNLDVVERIETSGPVAALALVGDDDENMLYAAVGAAIETIDLADDGPAVPQSMWMPGEVRAITDAPSAGLVHALGEAPEGGPTVYVIEPRGRSVFIDVPLGFEPTELLADAQPLRPDADRADLLAIAPDGSMATLEAGRNAFGWRLPGVLMGALTAGLLYLLARLLFARRTVALLVGVLVVAEGMLLANSRIAMNDVYVTAFIVLAAVLFVPLYLRPRRPWTAVALLLGVGLALGLALASKWVGLYAVGGLGLLVLLRSALGRALALVGLMGMTAVLGTMAVGLDDGPEAVRNWIFLALMLVLTGLLAAGMVRRPLPWTRSEVVLAVALPLAAGLGLVLLGQTVVGAAALVFGLLLALVGAFVAAGGRGPWAPDATEPPPGTSTWLRPGRVNVLPWLLTLTAITVLPLAVYLAAYSPWVELGNDWGLPAIGSVPFLAEGNEGGRTIADLTASMYRYHDDLRAEHAASSPWWAWPLDLKPVWFFQERYDDDTTGLIYDTGNLVIFWLGLAGLAFSAWAAWLRRSLALAVVVILWASLWLPWARIDRATFQYHVYASLPFLLLALGYFLAELWHGPSARAWLLARAASALAILGIPLLWLLRTPLCILAGTAVAHPDGVACAAVVTRTAQLSEGGAAAIALVVVGALFVVLLAWRASREGPGLRQGLWLVALALVALVTLAAVQAALLLLDSSQASALALSSDVLSLLAFAVLALPAWLVLRARDPRRLVVGVLAAALLWLLLWYPNIAGLPLPSEMAALYQGLLPTWNWDFQFAVNTTPASDGGIVGPGLVAIALVTLVFVLAVVAVARRWGGERPSSSR